MLEKNRAYYFDSMTLLAVILSTLLVGALVALVFLLRSWRQDRRRLERYASLSDAEAEEQALRREASEHQTQSTKLQQYSADLQQQIHLLQRELDALTEAQELQEFGVYQRRYDLDTAEAYKQRIEEVRDRQKGLVKNGEAAVCSTQWHVEGSYAKGQKMVREQLKLMLRAFNGECDAAIARVKYNNVQAMEKRIERAFSAVNKLGASKQCFITDEHLRLKLQELFLTHEHEEKRQEEKEEQRRIKEQMREEQRIQKEREKAIKEAEKEEARHEEALRRARDEIENATEAQRAKLQEEIAQLQQQVEDAKRKKSRAETTRSGHVYILSNIGSFGEHIYKIGMTRRLEPLERVRELSDASVPFGFDVHAMVYCEDAPSVESALHGKFDERRVNKVNLRREYFHVGLDEVAEAVRQLHGDFKLTKLAEAPEYYQTLAIERQGRPAAPARSNAQPPSASQPTYAAAVE